MINTVIFDLDGLLADTEKTWYLVFKHIYGDYGYELTLEEYVTCHSGKTLVDNIATMKERYPISIDSEAGVQRAIDDEAKFVARGVDLKPGAEELLYYLKTHGYKIVLGTSSKKDRAVMILKQNHIDHYFDAFVVGDEVKRSKPFPDIFLAAAERVDSVPEQCLVLEDSEAGIQAAYAAGIPVVCVPDLKQPGEEFAKKATAVLPSLHQVIEYLGVHGIK